MGERVRNRSQKSPQTYSFFTLVKPKYLDGKESMNDVVVPTTATINGLVGWMILERTLKP